MRELELELVRSVSGGYLLDRSPMLASSSQEQSNGEQTDQDDKIDDDGSDAYGWIDLSAADFNGDGGTSENLFIDQDGNVWAFIDPDPSTPTTGWFYQATDITVTTSPGSVGASASLGFDGQANGTVGVTWSQGTSTITYTIDPSVRFHSPPRPD